MTTNPVRDISWRGERLLPDPIDGSALRYTPVLPAHIDAISIHHTTGAGLPPTAAVADEIAYLRSIDTYHRNSRGLDAIGYQLVAFASGRVYVTAPLDRYGAAVGAHNNHTLSVALAGDFTTKPPSYAHLHAAAHAIAHINTYLGRTVDIRPHSYWSATACPGHTWTAWVPQLRAAANTITEVDNMGMTPAEKATLDIIQGQVNQLIALHQAGSQHEGDLRIIQGQVNQLIELHSNPLHGTASLQQIADGLKLTQK